MIKYLCDRCGIICDEVNKITFMVPDSGILQKGGITEIRSGWKEKEHHLCKDCHIRFLKFIKDLNLDGDKN